MHVMDAETAQGRIGVRPPSPKKRSSQIEPVTAPDVTITSATYGEEPLVQNLFRRSGFDVGTAEYLSQIEKPGYQPTQRLLLRRGSDVIGHLKLEDRPTRFAETWIPIAAFTECVAEPSIASTGLMDSVWEIAEATAQSAGAWGVLADRFAPQDREKQGWVHLGQPNELEVCPRQLLAQIRSNKTPRRTLLETIQESPEPSRSIQIWRQVEQSSLKPLYDVHCRFTSGPRERSSDYWRWLTARRGFDQIYISVEKEDASCVTGLARTISGYAVVRGSLILELAAATPEIERDLIERVCRDAIEQTYCSIRLLPLPPIDPRHDSLTKLAVAAGAHSCEADPACIKIFHPVRFLDRLRPLIGQRSRKAALKPKTELGFHIANRKFQLICGDDSVQLVPNRLGRSYLTLTRSDFVRLILGNLDLSCCLESGQAKASTQLAEETAAAIFPRSSWWISPWDSAPAIND